MTPAALAAIEAIIVDLESRMAVHAEDKSARVVFFHVAPTDLAALLAHIRTMEAEREAEIAAARNKALEEAAEIAEEWESAYAAARAIRKKAAAIREPKP